MKGFLLILLILFICSCNTDKKEEQINNDTIVDGIKTIDSTTIGQIKRVDSFNQNKNLFFSVYELSKNTIALVVNIVTGKKKTQSMIRFLTIYLRKIL